MMVPVPPFQHSPMLGHCASSHTVCRSSSRSDSYGCAGVVGRQVYDAQAGRHGSRRVCRETDLQLLEPRVGAPRRRYVEPVRPPPC